MAQSSDEELLDWIDELDEEELRQVLKYLILLNADAVQKALSYVRRGRRKRSGESLASSSSSSVVQVSISSEPLQTLPVSPSPSAPHRRSRSQNSDDITTSTMDSVVLVTNPLQETATLQQIPILETSSPRRSKESQSPAPSQSSKRSVPSTQSQQSKKLIVLCTSKPSSRKQGEDQDKAMVVCKQAGILPFIVLQESKPREAKELIKVSNILEFPQFFLEDQDITTFLGGYDTVYQLFVQGTFNVDILKPVPVTPTIPPPLPRPEPATDLATDTTSSNRRLDTFFQQSDYEESSDDEEESTNLTSHPKDMDDSKVVEGRNVAQKAAAADDDEQRQGEQNSQIGGHLEGLNQPKDLDDAKSIDSHELFDPPSPPPPEKPLLAAAQKAAEQLKREADLAKGVPVYLAGLNQPSIDDDSASLGDDPRTIFDPPTQPLSQKPLLEAAKRAAAQREQEIVTTLAPVPPSTSDVSDASALQRSIGFSQEKIILKPAGTRRPSGHLGETDSSDTRPPPSPSTTKSKFFSPQLPPRLSPANKLPPSHTNNDSLSSDAIVPSISPSSDQPAWMKILAEQEQGEQTSKEPIPDGPAWMANVASTSSSIASEPSAVQSSPTPSSPTSYTLSNPEQIQSCSNPTPPVSDPVGTSPVSQPAIESMTAVTKIPTEPQRGMERKKSAERKYPEGGACYLVYDAVVGELNIYYSEIPIVGAVGVWTSPNIQAFKQAQGLGKSELIGNCASGVQDRQHYYNGWCQFVRAAKSMDATVTILDVGVPVDFYLYLNGKTERVQSGSFETETVDAVACIPRNADFPIDVKGKKWSKAAKKIGAVAIFRSLSARDGSSSSGESSNSSMVAVGSLSQLEATPTIPEEEEMTEDALVHSSVSASPAPIASNPVQPVVGTVKSIAQPTPQLLQPDEPVKPVPKSPTSGYISAVAAPNPPGGACYLVYEPDSSGRLVEHYSKTPIEDAIGRWVPVGAKSIAGFKFKQNLGRNVLIGNCSAGVQGRKNYSSGWCQFVRSARVMEADVMLWDPVSKGLMVDVFLYQDDNRPTHQTVKLLPGVAHSVGKTLAVACIPKNTPFYEGMAVDILKWLADGSNYGASSRF